MMNSGDKFMKAMVLLRDVVEDAGMQLGVADGVQVIIPRRSFDGILNDITRNYLINPIMIYDRHKEFTFIGMKVLAGKAEGIDSEDDCLRSWFINYETEIRHALQSQAELKERVAILTNALEKITRHTEWDERNSEFYRSIAAATAIDALSQFRESEKKLGE